jgi:glucose-1-phosphate adenylyltransferase
MRKAVHPSEMRRVAAIILSGGEGSRLSPLTKATCKPAMSFGGKYRLIDIPISHSIHAGCTKIFVISQFLSASLHKHLLRTYSSISHAVELLAAEQRPGIRTWFQGSADAVRQNLEYLSESDIDYFIILAADQLYNMDFQKFIQYAQATDADLVIGVLPVGIAEAKRMGVIKLGSDFSIKEFYEKPQNPELLQTLLTSIPRYKQTSDNNVKESYLGSMGIYAFKREALFTLLKNESGEDFGKHLIPKKVAQGNVFAYLHQGYWEDIGTIESYFNANISLLSPNPPFNCYDESYPIFSQSHHLPPPKISCSKVHHTMICDGAVVEADSVERSILGPRSRIKKNCKIKDSYIIGHDWYSSPCGSDQSPAHVYIDEECHIEKAIIDKHVYIGKGVRLINAQKLADYTSDHLYVRDGVIIVTRGAILPDGFLF